MCDVLVEPAQGQISTTGDYWEKGPMEPVNVASADTTRQGSVAGTEKDGPPAEKNNSSVPREQEGTQNTAKDI